MAKQAPPDQPPDPAPKPSRTDEARHVVEGYAEDLRKLIDKLRKAIGARNSVFF